MGSTWTALTLGKRMSLARRLLRHTEDGTEGCLGVRIIELNNQESLVRRCRGRIRTSEGNRGGRAGLPTRLIKLRILLIHQSRDRIYWKPILRNRDTGEGHRARPDRLGGRLRRHPLHLAHGLQRCRCKRRGQLRIYQIDRRVLIQRRSQLLICQADLKVLQPKGFAQGTSQAGVGGQQIQQQFWCYLHKYQVQTRLGPLARTLNRFLAMLTALA